MIGCRARTAILINMRWASKANNERCTRLFDEISLETKFRRYFAEFSGRLLLFQSARNFEVRFARNFARPENLLQILEQTFILFAKRF